jgi:hypothetical protein
MKFHSFLTLILLLAGLADASPIVIRNATLIDPPIRRPIFGILERSLR